MRDPLLHLPAESDFDNLCRIADQTSSVNHKPLAEELRSSLLITRDAARGRRIHRSHLNYFLGDFDDFS